jgi:hypothetical protein
MYFLKKIFLKITIFTLRKIHEHKLVNLRFLYIFLINMGIRVSLRALHLQQLLINIFYFIY